MIGKTDKNCITITERPIHVEELLATLYRKLGVSYNKVFQTPIGRPVRIIDEPFEPIKELLS